MLLMSVESLNVIAVYPTLQKIPLKRLWLLSKSMSIEREAGNSILNHACLRVHNRSSNMRARALESGNFKLNRIKIL